MARGWPPSCWAPCRSRYRPRGPGLRALFAAPRRRLTERVERWARSRQGTDALPLVLRAGRLYILPNRTGLGFAVLLFVMLVAGLNYTNSLALFLTFMSAGLVVVGMHECQRTLQGLELVQVQVGECHAGGVGTIELRFANPAPLARRALTVRADAPDATEFDIAALAARLVRLPFHPARRGRMRLGRLELASTAPFGLFRCWTWLYLPVEVIVHPQPAGSRPLPRPTAGRVARQSVAGSPGDEEWMSLRAYQVGDSPRSIAWKAWAREAPLMVGQYAGGGGSDHVLSFAGLEALDLEARLSQLCAWVEQCVRIDAAYALRLPGCDLPLGRGAAHRAQVLRELALYGGEPA